MTRSARFPFSFGQAVLHSALPELPLRVLHQEADAEGNWTISVTDARGGGFWRFPAHELAYADIAEEQREIAAWLGCSVERMNAEHDALHARLARWTGLPSRSLRIAAGGTLPPKEAEVAALEEDAVLYVQRYLCAALEIAA